MNTYILYHQKMSRSLAELKATSCDVFEVTSGCNGSSGETYEAVEEIK
jgi:hypothetical protein